MMMMMVDVELKNVKKGLRYVHFEGVFFPKKKKRKNQYNAINGDGKLPVYILNTRREAFSVHFKFKSITQIWKGVSEV